MANSGRTAKRYHRIYINGYDLSGDVSDFGDLDWDFPIQPQAALNWEVAGGMCDTPTIRTGPVNGMLRTASGAGVMNPHSLVTGWQGLPASLIIALGIQAPPMMGDPAWCVSHRVRKAVAGVPAGSMLTLSMEYAPSWSDASGNAMNYDVPWGVILHPSGAETAANTATGHDNGASSAAGGWMMVQALAVAGTGTATFKVQHAAANVNGSFADVAGLSVALADTDIPGAGIAQAATTATINRYTRFQVSLSGVTSVSFVLALVRGR